MTGMPDGEDHGGDGVRRACSRRAGTRARLMPIRILSVNHAWRGRQCGVAISRMVVSFRVALVAARSLAATASRRCANV